MVSLFKKNIPTLDIYFRGPLKQIISDHVFATSKRPVRRLGPYSFFANGRVVIIRYITRRELRKIHSLKPARCYYLIDDDLQAVAHDQTLPEYYRKKLMLFAREMLPDILALADTIVAPNPLIHQTYPDKISLLLNPSFSALCRDFSHFEQASNVNVLFSGTRSHINDLLLISDVMVDICRRHPYVRFTTFMGNHAPGSLKGLENIIHRQAKPWTDFRRILQTERYHIALAPYRDTPFNRARSINKILDHAAFGAAALYSNRPPFVGTIEHGRNGKLLDDQPESWRGAIEDLISNMSSACQLAKEGVSFAQMIGDPENVRQFWLKELFGDEKC